VADDNLVYNSKFQAGFCYLKPYLEKKKKKKKKRKDRKYYRAENISVSKVLVYMQVFNPQYP
jgi:hypothetical protein